LTEKAKTKAEKTEQSFEEAMQRLEEIVTRLEGGTTALEESLQLFEEGAALARYCQEKLQAAQGRLDILLRRDEEGVVTEPFQLQLEEEA
jgi:exodeoxyribonuclease VII small subunit